MSSLLNQTVVFGVIGGLGLFLFGMKIMSEGLQKVAGNRIRKILAALTCNRFVSMLVGMTVTAIIQSSSATTVMVVGFVNAGLLSLVQSIGVVLGANIGTTITAQLIAFKITHYALPAIGLGVALKLFSRSRRWAYIGEVILGFGILFFGLAVMKEAMEPIKESEAFRALFMGIGHNHLLGVLIGAILTVILQSSSATIGITLALATNGLLTFEASIALILGENIGTTITANLAAIGTSLPAKRTALSHFLFNSIGVIYMLILFPFFLELINSLTPGEADFIAQTQQQAAMFGVSIGDKPFIARHIANTHTFFNIINTLLFLPLIGWLAKLTTFFLRGEEVETEFRLKHIDMRVLNTPPIALGQARSETLRMARLAEECLDEVLLYYEDQDEKHLKSLEKKEDHIDLLQKEITNFLVALSQLSITQEISKEIGSLMHMVNDLERVGDHCENLWQLGTRKKEEKIDFSDIAKQEIQEISKKTRGFLGFVVNALENRDVNIKETALTMENCVDKLEENLRNNHITRLNTGECTVLSGLIYIDMLHNFEKIADHTYNVSEAVRGVK
ncbi:MAG: Na/Pi cotransporter family protein [Deltaproteobacteria bacterium]|nr:Na/Pi cotransporter family protein [Deltaproteobacteria bacterium]